MKAKLRVFWCSMWGCEMGDDGHCVRCGEHFYGMWYETGHLSRLWRWLHSFKWGYCHVCGKRLPWRTRRELCCSDECYENLGVPF